MRLEPAAEAVRQSTGDQNGTTTPGRADGVRHPICSIPMIADIMNSRGDTMPDVTDALLDRMIRAIVDEVDPEQVILFGSRARGDARPDSDVDLLIIESEPFGGGRSSHAERVRLNRALPATPVDNDVLVYSRDEIERWRGSLNHVAARALREGRVLYTRDWGVPSPTSRPCSVRDGDQPQPDIQQARLLLGMADGDLGALRVMHRPADVTDEIFRFHVQQAAEKCFKAWIAMLGEEYPLTHNLGELMDVIRPWDTAVSQHATLKAFSAFAANCRYAPLPEDAGPIDRPAAVGQVEALMQKVRRLIPAMESRAE